MLQVKQVIAVLLVAHLALGTTELVWSQAFSKNDKGRLQGSEGTQRVGEKSGPTRGIMSRTPSEEDLPGGQALSRAVVRDEYILGPGDGLTINLWGEFEESASVRVTPDGKISLPTIGELEVNGLSLAKASALIDSAVKRHYRNVKSGLSLTSLRVFEVSVLGAVQMPGAYLATPVKRVSSLVMQAGGVVPGGSSRRILVRRNGQTVATADLTSYFRRGDESANPFVKDGDVIFVPPMGDVIVSLITNEVAVSTGSGQLTENSTPSNVELVEGERISHLFAELGGVSPWWNLEGVYLVRETKVPQGVMTINVDVHRLIYGKDDTQDVELLNGDQLFIPSKVRRVFVNGVVRTGGAFPYVPSRTAEEYLGVAGGITLQADLDRSTIRHADGTVEPYHPGTVLLVGDAIQIEQKYFATPSDYVGLVGGIVSLVFSTFAFLTVLK